MLSFAAPLIFLLLPLPWLVWRFAPPYRARSSALRVPFFRGIADASGQTPASGATALPRSGLQMGALFFCWCLLVAGLARPEILGEPQVIESSARDVILAIDISGSMDTRDFASADGPPIQRLEAVKDVVRDFIASRDGDRVALIVFGSGAYLQTPFTEDLDGAAAMLEQMRVGMAGPHTAIGDAIGLALHTFETSRIEQKLLILLSDGTDTNSRMSPLNATEVAADAGIAIHTIGVGDPNAAGEDRVDIATLEAVADRTGGAFYMAEDTQGLRAVYDGIDALTPRLVESRTFQPRTGVSHIAFAAALLVMATLLGVSAGRRTRDA